MTAPFRTEDLKGISACQVTLRFGIGSLAAEALESIGIGIPNHCVVSGIALIQHLFRSSPHLIHGELEELHDEALEFIGESHADERLLLHEDVRHAVFARLGKAENSQDTGFHALPS